MSIVVKELTYTYMSGTPYEKKALDNVSIEINEGEFLGIIGKTGSGKSTFVQHLNALIKLTSGEISVFNIDLTVKKPDYRRLRGIVGMVFQYPEYQLFDETVEKDVGFGPRNLMLSDEEIKVRIRDAIEMVGLDYEAIKDRSPFELSGGQKRRVAIAGVIAMRPKVLILDEPTAGLDPRGKKEILQLVKKLKAECCPTVIMITHDMDSAAEYSSKIAVFNDGKLAAYDTPSAIFGNKCLIEECALDLPVAAKVAAELRSRGVRVPNSVVTPDALIKSILALRGKRA